MRFKNDKTEAGYYKKLGDSAFDKQQYDKAGKYYLKCLQIYPFTAVLSKAKRSLKYFDNVEVESLLNNLTEYQKSFLRKKAGEFIQPIQTSKKYSNFHQLKMEFYKYPYQKFPDIVELIQLGIGGRLIATHDSNLIHLFLDLSKYNSSENLRPYVEEILNNFKNEECVENAIFDFTTLVRHFGDLIRERLSEFSEQLIAILDSSIGWNERRFSIFALEVLGEYNFKLIERALPVLYKNIEDPVGILESLRKKVAVMRTPLFEVHINVETVSSPHIWILDACIDAISSLTKKYADRLEYFVPVIVKQFEHGNFYTKKKSLKALLNFQENGVDVTKYLPKKKIEEDAKYLLN